MQTGCFDYNKDDEYVIIHDNGKGKLIAWSVAEHEIHSKCKWLLYRGLEILGVYKKVGD